MNYIPLKDETLTKQCKAVFVADFYLDKLTDELEKQILYSENTEEYYKKYRAYGPDKSDISRICDNIRKIMLDIKKAYI